MTTTITMPIPESALVHACRAEHAHANDVGDALRMYLTARTPEGAAFAAGKVRAALVAMSEGFECGAHDGCTFATRRSESKLALAAWTDVAVQS